MFNQIAPLETNLQKQLDAYLKEFTDAVQSAMTVKDYIKRLDIRVLTTKNKLLFDLADVARVINDVHFKSYTSDALIEIPTMDSMGRKEIYKVVDEAKLHEYLLNTPTPSAKILQLWLMDMNEVARAKNKAEKLANCVNLLDILAKLKVDTKIPADIIAEIKGAKIPLEELTRMAKK